MATSLSQDWENKKAQNAYEQQVNEQNRQINIKNIEAKNDYDTKIAAQTTIDNNYINQINTVTTQEQLNDLILQMNSAGNAGPDVNKAIASRQIYLNTQQANIDAANISTINSATSEEELNNIWDNLIITGSNTQAAYSALKSRENYFKEQVKQSQENFKTDLLYAQSVPSSEEEIDSWIKQYEDIFKKYDKNPNTPEFDPSNQEMADLYNQYSKRIDDRVKLHNDVITAQNNLSKIEYDNYTANNTEVVTPTYKPYQLDQSMDENGFYKLNKKEFGTFTPAVLTGTANDSGEKLLGITPSGKNLSIDTTSTFDKSVNTINEIHNARPTKIQTFITEYESSLNKINEDFFKTPLGSAIESIPYVGAIYKDVIIPVGQAPIKPIGTVGPRLVSGDIGQTIIGGSDVIAAAGGPVTYLGLKTIETGSNKGIWDTLIKLDDSGKQTGLIADITKVGTKTPVIGEYVGYGGELLGGLTYSGLHNPAEFYTFGKLAGGAEKIIPYGKYGVGAAFGVQTAASSVMGDEPNWGKAITQGALVTAAPYLIKNIPKVPIVKYYEGLRGKAEWLADIPKTQQREALDVQKIISDLRGQTKISNPLNLDRVASIKTPEMKADTIAFAQKNPEIIYGGSTQLERGMTGTIKRAPQDLEAYFKTTNIKPNKGTSWTDLGKPVIPKSLEENVLDVHPQEARNIQQSAYFKAQKTPVPELFPTLRKTLGSFDNLSGAIEETTIMGTNIKIKAVKSFNIAVRKGTAAYDIGNPDKTTGIKTPTYRYSKDIPAFIQYAKDISAQRQLTPTTNVPVLKQFYEWKAGRLSERLKAYEDLTTVEKAPPTLNRPIKRIPLIKSEWFGKKIEPFLGEEGSFGYSTERTGKIILPSFDKGYYFKPKNPIKVNLTVPGYTSTKTNYTPNVNVLKGYNINYPAVNKIQNGYVVKDYTSKDYVPKDYIPRDYVPRDYTPKDYVPKDYTPKDYTPRDYVPKDFIPRDYIPKGYTPKDYIPRDYVPQENLKKLPYNIPFKNNQGTDKNKKYAKSYDVYVRKGVQKGKVQEILVQKGLPYGTATNLGLGIAAEYSQRTAILKPSKKSSMVPDEMVNKDLLGKFRPLALRSKIPQSKQSRTFVEKSRYAIDTLAEKKGIPYKAAALRRAKSNIYGGFGGMKI